MAADLYVLLIKCYWGRVLVSSGFPQVTIREGLERTCSGVEYLFVLGREGIISIIVIQLPDSVMKLKITVCLLSIFKQLRVVERIEDTIFVLIFFIWDTVLANQNDDVVDADWLHLSSGISNRFTSQPQSKTVKIAP